MINNRKNNNQHRFSRVHRNHEDKHFSIDGMGLTILCVIVLGGLVFFCVKDYQHHKLITSSPIATNTSKPVNNNVISAQIKTYPKVLVFADGNEIGKTDNRGRMSLHSIKVGAKLSAKYGSNNSAPVVITKADRNKNISFDFSSLDKHSAQRVFNDLYQGVTNLYNNNDQTTADGSLEDFYLGGSHNSAYMSMFKWGKAQYKQFQQNTDDDDDNDEMNVSSDDTVKDKPRQPKRHYEYNAVHFIVNVKHTYLNSNGTVNVDYTVKNDFAGDKHDHVDVFNWTATLKKHGSDWEIMSAQPTPDPVQSYND